MAQQQHAWIHPESGFVQPIPTALKNHLVMHRGYHSSHDHVSRPLENTVQAYEMAWALGAKYAECDVTLTSDKVIVLCHDDDYYRLALKKDFPAAKKRVNELSLADVKSLALINGTTPSTLEEVLVAAKLLDGKLVVEIKGEDLECARAVAHFMTKRPDLANHVAVVMGFYAITVYEFARSLPCRGETLIMLLTVCEERVKSDKWDGPVLDLQDTSKLEALLTDPKDGTKIDGVYVELETKFVPPLPPTFVDLVKRIPVGIWGRSKQDTDQMDLWEPLVAAGVRFVNTDMPDLFFKRSRNPPHARLVGETDGNNNNSGGRMKRVKKQ